MVEGFEPPPLNALKVFLMCQLLLTQEHLSGVEGREGGREARGGRGGGRGGLNDQRVLASNFAQVTIASNNSN